MTQIEKNFSAADQWFGPILQSSQWAASLEKCLIVCNALPNHRKQHDRRRILNIHYLVRKEKKSHVLNKLGINYLERLPNVRKWHLCT